MTICNYRFNIYLLLALALGVVCGCQTPERKAKKLEATLRVHLEVNQDGTDKTKPVPIYRDNPFTFNIETSPFLTEANVKEAKVVDTVGGFALQLQFDRRGTWLLLQYSLANRGRHLAIFSRFVSPQDDKLSPGRWLAAPLLSQRISNGLLLFTPDVSREEANQIVLGLNNLARKNKKNSEWNQ